METMPRAGSQPTRADAESVGEDAEALEARDGMARYLREVNRCRLLSRAEEKSLLARVRLRDRNALHTLITANLKWVVAVSAGYRGRGLPMAELIAEGNLALIRAALSFAPDQAFRFTAYAIWWIRQGLERALAAQSVPGTAAGLPPSSPVPVPSRDPVDDPRRGSAVRRALESLHEPGRTILKLYFGFETGRAYALEEIARILGLDPDRARVLKERALRRLQASFSAVPAPSGAPPLRA